MSKKIIFSMLSLGTLALGSSVFASSNISVNAPITAISQQSESEKVYDLEDLSYEVVDPMGNIIASGSVVDGNGDISTYAYNVAKSTVEPGSTIYWYPTDSTSGFYLQKNDVVEISLKLSKAVRIEIGLTKGTSKETTDKNPSVSLVQSSAGYSKMSVSNLSSSSITVNSGTISYNE